MMTDQELAEIEAREKAATPGPWKWDPTWGGGAATKKISISPNRILETAMAQCVNHIVIEETQTRTDHFDWKAHTKEDAKFIAHARQDIPALIAEIKRLKALHED